MLIKIAIAVLVLIVGFLVYVSTRTGTFRYERSGVIEASAEQIFPYISQFSLGSQWSPYEKMAPEMKKSFSGQDGQVGSKMEFESREAGSGSLEMLKIVPNQAVDIKLIMTAPFKGENLVQYQLTPEGDGTRFTWIMSGDGGFMTKLMTVFIDCEKMIGDQFSTGINNLKNLVESKK